MGKGQILGVIIIVVSLLIGIGHNSRHLNQLEDLVVNRGEYLNEFNELRESLDGFEKVCSHSSSEIDRSYMYPCVYYWREAICDPPYNLCTTVCIDESNKVRGFGSETGRAHYRHCVSECRLIFDICEIEHPIGDDGVIPLSSIHLSNCSHLMNHTIEVCDEWILTKKEN